VTHANLSLTAPALVVSVVVYVFFAAGSVALSIIDARTKLLPNRIVFPLYGIGLAGFGTITALLHNGSAVTHLVTAVAAAAVLFGIFYAIAMFGPMGYGDVKLAGVIGLYLGWLGIPVVFAGILLGTILAALAAVGIVVVRSVRRQPWRRTEIPYGPYLLLGAWAAILLNLWA
jgi:leader peptidase (prepilin peptidase)/N-methyltransferase